MAAAANKVERAHELYREGRFGEALELYSIALSFAKNTPQRIALHSNRAACFLKLHLFNQASAECTSVLELDHRHTGALMLRAQTLVTLKDYQSALFDVNRLLDFNPLSDVYLDLQARLKTQLSLAPIPEEEEEEEDDDTNEDIVERDKNPEDSDWLQKTEDTSVKYELKDDDDDENICSGPNSSPVSSNSHSNGWREIEKPKGHSRLDYSRWDSVDDGSNDDDDDSDEETQPRYKFRFKTVDLKHVK